MATRNTGGNEGVRDTNPGDVQRGSSPPTLKDQAADLGRKAGRGVRQAANEAQAQAESRIDRGKRDAAMTLTSVASRLRESGSQLRSSDSQDFAGEYVERAAEQIERIARYVDSADLREVVDQVEDFARRRPAVFIGGAFAAGLLAARFIKSSRASRFTDEEGGRYLDREVPSEVARETGRSYPPSNPWREPL
jgi:hypothetical protein